MVRRTVDLLPEIFRTDTNKKFLAATLDQLTQDPVLEKTYGFVGRRVGPGVDPADNYVTESSAVRQDYQLEPGVVFFAPDTNRVVDAITYPGMIDALNLQGANSNRQDRLWESQYYTWDPFVDLDKLVNYSQYYWVPGGPDSVDVNTATVPLINSWTVSRVVTAETQAYQFSDIKGNNPVITLVRGGNYQFTVNQPGHGFWIQAEPGVSGTMSATPNISSRDVLGVENNGTQGGTVIFNVPLKSAQEFYSTMPEVGPVDLVSETIQLADLNNIYVDQFFAQYPNGIDGITNLNGRTVVFTNRIVNAETGGWQLNTQFDPLVRIPSNNGLLGSYDTELFDQTTDINQLSQRYSVWQIQYINDDDGRPYMRLSSIAEIPELNRFRVLFGTQWSSTSWYKDASGYLQKIPLQTAVLDTLYYQDSTNPALFGRIQLIDPEQNQPLDLNEIVGAKNYISPNGVQFTNGLKIQLRGLINPPQYQALEFYVEGVGTGPGIDARVGFIDGEAYFGPWHYYQGQKMTGASHSEEVFQQYIYDTLEESLANPGAGGPAGAPLPSEDIFGATEGNGIRLLPVSDFVTPETYTRSATIPYDSTSYDSTTYDASLNAPVIPDYITINRAARDLNAWSRSNRWFHIDVLNYTAELNGQVAVLDNNFRAKRPIVEFRAGLELYNFGTQGKQPINIIDFYETDALSKINGQRGYNFDGYPFINGTRVIFAADADAQVRNRIYEVQFIDPNNSGVFIIDLVPVFDGIAEINQTVVCLSGNTLQGKSFWFDGVTWQAAQEKTGVNQSPLFDVRDAQGISYGNRAVYPSTTFQGSKLFGYAINPNSRADEVLGFGLKYLNINNVGDILFDNYFYNDTFLYVRDNVSNELEISNGYVRQYVDRTLYSNLIGWQTAAAENRSRQVFRFNFDGNALIFDVPPAPDTVYPVLQIYVDGVFYDPDQYTVTSDSQRTYVTFANPPAVGTIIEAQIISNVRSSVAYYQIPLNLENNPLNEDSTAFTLGTVRNHYNSIGQNLKDIVGPINGANNSRDLGNILRYGDNIVQHSSPLALTGVFLRQQQYELFNAIRFNSQEYEKYKAILLDLASKGDFVNNTPTQVLDQIMTEISASKTNMSPFYWSDMVPSGETYTENTYTYTPISTPVFDTNAVYNFSSSNYQGLLVFVNGVLLAKDYDYEVGVDSPTITVTRPLAVGDRIVIREYSTTYGSFVPNTPTKMGLYPAFRPQMFEDKTSTSPVMVIQGHDGSITRAFGDYRDAVLLEFETRIFDNLKIQTPVPIEAAEVIPGQFRTTDYSLAEVNNMLSTDFLTWIGWNKLDYTTQNYLANNEFTYNYSQSGDRLNNRPLLGAWRGIYQYFYDTVSPNTTPWEMLGFSEEPTWWQDFYGPAPYTSGNLVLWEDLEQGLVRDPAGEYILPQYARPGLTQVIPSDSEGNLLSPLGAVAGNYDATSFRRSWTFGDGGPVESSWRSSSSYPFAIMRLLALTKPAKFFSLFADRDRYVFDPALDQYLWDGRYRLDAKKLDPLYGDGVSKASYVNWIIDYNRQLGSNSTTDLEIALANIGVRLCWRLGAFSDKKYLKIYTERSTPNSTNTSLLLPDESYQLLLYKNQPFERVIYSSVIVQKTDTGYAVLGYSATRPYFNILASRVGGRSDTITVGSQTVRVLLEHSDNVVQVPYGYVFTNATAVCDFLVSYGKLLERQGMVFDNQENGYVLNWMQMAQEFLYWSQQGWGPGSIVNLNPAATTINVTRANAVADSLATPSPDNIILNQNRLALNPANLVINRLDNTFQAVSLTNETINYLDLKFTAYEHIIVLDDVSIFADLIYDPLTGSRQSRVLVSGWLSGNWNGTVNAPGFVLNQDNIVEWVPNRKYAKGEIVLFKNEYWSASTIIQPSEQFNYNLWIKSDFDEVQKGLLPNAANASDQLSAAYSVYNANLEQEVDLFSYGLIGFRPREYMQALNLDDVSQVGLYQQFLGTKGTTRSAELFTFADLGKETAQYEIFEYWAMLRSQYGATANRSYYELLLNEARLQSDPALIQVINPGETSQADQTVLLENVWKSSYKLTSPNILPTTTSPVTDIGLPTAGYANLDDVDLAVFSLDDLQTINDNLAQIGVGTTIWFAKVNAYDWNVYRTELVPGEVILASDNLNGRALIEFNQEHGLSVGDLVIIRFFNDSINGVYRVQSVPSIFSILIDYQFNGLQNSIEGNGVAFVLQTSRVSQPSDILNLPYAKQLTAGARVWVNDDSTGRWTVLEKTDPFSEILSITPQDESSAQNFGTAISQSTRNLNAMVGAPGYNQGKGGIYTYVKESNNRYVQDRDVFSVDTTGIQGLGTSIEIGSQAWAVTGAPASNNNNGYAVTIYRSPENVIGKRQLLVSPDQDFASAEFGYSVAMSRDERWMYVGAPGKNKVYAYGRVDLQPQEIVHITESGVNTYSFAGAIEIDSGSAGENQIGVVLDNILLTINVDYFVQSTNIVLLQTPAPGKTLLIIRRADYQLDTENYTITGGYTVLPAGGSGASFFVNVVRGSYSPTLIAGGAGFDKDDLITIPGTDLGGSSPANDLVIRVTQTGPNYATNVTLGATQLTIGSTDGLSAGQTIHYFSGSGGITVGTTIVSVDSPTQFTIDNPITGTGTLVFFVSPNPITAIEYISGSGDASQTVFNITDYLYTVDDIFSFVITVNDNLYRPFIDYTFDANTGDVTFLTSPAQGSAIIVRSQTYWDYVETLSVSGLDSTDRFGHSLSTSVDGRQLLIGAPRVTVDGQIQAGRTFVIDRSVERFQVTDTAERSYTTVNPFQGPVSVNLNGTFLVDADQFIGGQFTASGSTVTLNSSVELTLGDTIEIGTNQFSLLQVLESTSPSREAEFGYALDQCVNSCSLYVGAPFDSTQAPKAGRVEYFQNQARVYGTITSTVANPTLTSGQYIRINDVFVSCVGTTIEDFVEDINAAILAGDLPNVAVATTPDAEFIADGTQRSFDIGNMYSSAASYTTVVYVDDVLQTSGYTYNNSTEIITFTSAPAAGSRIRVVSGRMTLTVKNFESAPTLDKLQVLPGTGTLFDDIGFDIFVNQQVIENPTSQDSGNFGKTVVIADNSRELVVGAPNASTIRPTTFDNNKTVFDAKSTKFADPVLQSGAVYVYDFLPSTNSTVFNPGRFVFGQQVYDLNIAPLDGFGSAINFVSGILMVGSPISDAGDSALGDYGRVTQFINETQQPAWKTIRLQQPVVDISLLNTVFMYDRIAGNTKQYFDYFNPQQGRVLGAVRQNIDFIGAVDPAAYNVGELNNYGQRWAQERVGQIWWDTDNVRFLDTNQDDIVYASRRWGQPFPGSTIDVYQWVSSDVPPVDYAGPGTPRNTFSYSVTSSINEQGLFVTTYYFWVTGVTSVNQTARKTLSTDTIARYIESPRSSGISYIAPIDASTIAIYNGLEYISAEDTIIHVEFDQQFTEDAVHVEYQLIAQDRADGILTGGLYQKLLDSFTGTDVAGNLVPDPFLTPSEKYGPAFRPRQSFFINRLLALQNYLQRANTVLAQFPISEIRSFNLLNSEEAEPSRASGAWDKRLLNYEELGYQDIYQVSLGYRYLVVSDATNNGLWTVYQVEDGDIPGKRKLSLIRVQNYDTKQYWNYIDWYQPGYNPLTRPVAEVPNESALDTLTLPEGSTVKVTANAQGKFEIYQLTAGEWIRVGLQDGTIAFSAKLWDYSLGRFGFDVEVFDAQYFDKEPTVETRKIIEAINQELFIDELAIERNRVLVLIFNYILSEQQAPLWLTKTSLVDVDHTIRELVPFQIYRQDNQDFVLNYIQEVKPYHVQIREFNLKYNGFDQYDGTATDFDLPAFWDAAQNQFISPILDNSGTLSTTSSFPDTATVWQELPWNQWYQNYLLTLESVTVYTRGSGYIVPPTILINGEITDLLQARVNTAGELIGVDVVGDLSGFLTTPTLTLDGVGSGARIIPVMGNNLVRQFTTTIKYDRYEYQSSIVEWQANTGYPAGTLVRYDARVWSANTYLNTAEFDPLQWTLVPANDLSGVDRTMGYYVPAENQPGLDLALLISGVDYPGVQVYGLNFDQNTGFDVGNYDINPFDNISYGPEGLPTYDPGLLDAIYESDFVDPYLGVGPAAIDVDGGAFVDTYESHAPEELVPGIIYDTLDMRVFTTPGSDWTVDGHGFALANISHYFTVPGSVYSFQDVLPYPVTIKVYNRNTGTELLLGTNFTIDWPNQSITVNSGAGLGDILQITVYELGGGNQLYRNAYNGADIGESVIVPVNYSLIQQPVIFVNGVQTTDFVYSEFDTTSTTIEFNTPLTSSDFAVITILGVDGSFSWSAPITQYFNSVGQLSYTLTNNLSGTNPANIIVEVNGRRARPAEGVEYLADGSSLEYYLPENGGYSQGIVADNDVSVYINNTPLTLGSQFTVTPWDGSNTRTIVLATLPPVGAKILISVRTAAQYTVVGNMLTFKAGGGLVPILGDVISVTTWNDTAQQNLLTQVWAGPTTQGITISQPYDSTDFDSASTTNTPGSFDYSVGIITQTNRFDTGRLIENTSRLMVTLNGRWLFEDQDFTVDGTVVILSGPTINAADIVAITSFTDSVVPGEIAFRIFQDMRGVQSTYRISASTSTKLAQDLSATDDVIYVDDASRLSEPNLPAGIFGLITINGERITYRNRDTTNNTVSGLRRGTAGTGAADHAAGANVYDIGIGNLLPPEYQDRIVAQNFLGDGVTVTFEATEISVDGLDSTELTDAVQVYVGGLLQTSGYTVTGSGPVAVDFDQAPTAGYQVSIQVRRGLSWYQPGPGTPSDGVPLQETNTVAARFIRGD